MSCQLILTMAMKLTYWSNGNLTQIHSFKYSVGIYHTVFMCQANKTYDIQVKKKDCIMRDLANSKRVKLEDNLRVFFYVCLFIFEGEREKVSKGGAEREREIQNPKQVCTGSAEPNVGFDLMNHGIMT